MLGLGRTKTMGDSGLWNLTSAVVPEFVIDAIRSVLSPQAMLTCISTLVRLFQDATAELGT